MNVRGENAFALETLFKAPGSWLRAREIIKCP